MSSVDKVGRLPHWRIFFAFAAAALLVYGVMFASTFQEDDYDLLYGVATGGPFARWTFGPVNFFRPGISLTFWAQWQIWGFWAAPYRIFNDLVHAAAATMVSLLVWEVIGQRDHRKAISISAGLLFLLSPARAEAVNWIAARTDLCGAFLGLLSLLLFVRHVNEEHRGLPWAAWAAFAAGMLCKESVVLVPVLAGAYSLSRKQRPWTSISGYGVVLVAYAALRVSLMGTNLQGNLERSHGAKLLGTTAVQIARLFVPGLPLGGPSNATNLEAIKSPVGAAVLLIGLALAAVTFTLLRKPEWRQPASFLILGTGLTIIPVVGLPVMLLRSSGERFVYLPAAFAIPLLAMALFVYLPKIAKPIVAVLAVVGVVLLEWQNDYWRQGAEVSALTFDSFKRDVLPQVGSAKEIVLLNVPARVEGGYGVAYVLDDFSPFLRKGQPLRVYLLSVNSQRREEADYILSRYGDTVSLRSLSDASFDLENSKLIPLPESMRTKAIQTFTPQSLTVDLAALPKDAPVFYWSGRRFEKIG